MNHIKRHQIDYIEFASTDLNQTKLFYKNIFEWQFEDINESYISFNDGRLNGGFFKTQTRKTETSPLIVIYTEDIETLKNRIKIEKGLITKDIFEFPGGSRFHFTDPSGNELAVWSDKKKRLEADT